MIYIAYGSNMSREQMTYRCPDAKLIGVGRIDRARLEFYLHATVEYTRLGADSVPVAVWEISEADERRLDRYEGFPDYYTKRKWIVRMADGSKLSGMIYLMRIIRPQPPTKGYYEGIRDAYRDLGLDSEIDAVLRPALTRAHARIRGRAFKK